MRLHANLADGFAVAAVGQHDLHLAVAPFLAPLPQRQNHGKQALALRCQRIDYLPPVTRIRQTLEDSAGDQFGQPVGKYVARDAEARLEFLEMLEAIQRPAKDQESPFLADQLDRWRERTGKSGLLEGVDMRRNSVRRQLAVPPSVRLE